MCTKIFCVHLCIVQCICIFKRVICLLLSQKCTFFVCHYPFLDSDLFQTIHKERTIGPLCKQSKTSKTPIFCITIFTKFRCISLQQQISVWNSMYSTLIAMRYKSRKVSASYAFFALDVIFASTVGHHHRRHQQSEYWWMKCVSNEWVNHSVYLYASAKKFIHAILFYIFFWRLFACSRCVCTMLNST